jgi:DNA mismatch repair protein MutL
MPSQSSAPPGYLGGDSTSPVGAPKGARTDATIEGDSREERILATIACHSAVKLGDKLSHQDMEGLIKDWLGSRYPATCPHGRSICYRLDHNGIARKLDRH